jgi:hypothetical protein
MIFVDIVKIEVKLAEGRNSSSCNFVIAIAIVIIIAIDFLIAIVNLLCNFVLQIN